MIVARYFVVGGTCAAVDFLVFSALAGWLGVHWFSAGLLSFTLATAVNYQLSTGFVFSSGARFNRNQEIGLVFLASAVGLAFNQFALWISYQHLGIDLYVSKLCATGTVFFWNYGARRFYIFRKLEP